MKDIDLSKGFELLIGTSDFLNLSRSCKDKSRKIVVRLLASMEKKRDYKKYLQCKEEMVEKLSLYLLVRDIEIKTQRKSLKESVKELGKLGALLDELASYFGGTQDLNDLSKALIASKLSKDKREFELYQQEVTTFCSTLSNAARSISNEPWEALPDFELLLDVIVEIARCLERSEAQIGKGPNSVFVYYLERLFELLDIEISALHFTRDRLLPELERVRVNGEESD